MIIYRNFYPVGQGVFYSERIYDNKGQNVFNVIYDCGSSTKGGLHIIEDIISREFTKNKIDYLFLSHLHDDHVNGLDLFNKNKIKINNIVLPLVHEIDELLISEISQSNMLVKELRAKFQDSIFYYVKEIESNNKEEKGDEKNKYIPFGKSIVDLKQFGINWSYIPFNFKDTTIMKKINDEFPNEVLDQEFITRNKARLRVLYKEIDSDININSLVLFSGTNEFNLTYNIASNSNCCYSRYIHPVLKNKSNCVYFGDFNLNSNQGINSIEEIKCKLGDELENNIGTIQIPHHGSGDSYNQKIMNLGWHHKNYVISHGIVNKYNHPSLKIIYKLYDNPIGYNNIFLVNEKESSELIQKIDLG